MTQQDNGGLSIPNHVELGWGAPPISEQFAGVLPKDTLEMFDKDKDAISQLRLRGYMTDNGHAAIVKKFTKSLGDKIIAARKGGAE